MEAYNNGAAFLRNAYLVEAAYLKFIAELGKVSVSEAHGVACGQWMRLQRQSSPLATLQEVLLNGAVPLGVWNAHDATIYQFTGLAAQYRAQELLPENLQSLFVYSALCGVSAACWGHLPEDLFPAALRSELAAAWPL